METIPAGRPRYRSRRHPGTDRRQGRSRCWPRHWKPRWPSSWRGTLTSGTSTATAWRSQRLPAGALVGHRHRADPDSPAADDRQLARRASPGSAARSCRATRGGAPSVDNLIPVPEGSVQRGLLAGAGGDPGCLRTLQDEYQACLRWRYPIIHEREDRLLPGWQRRHDHGGRTSDEGAGSRSVVGRLAAPLSHWAVASHTRVACSHLD